MQDKVHTMGSVTRTGTTSQNGKLESFCHNLRCLNTLIEHHLTCKLCQYDSVIIYNMYCEVNIINNKNDIY